VRVPVAALAASLVLTLPALARGGPSTDDRPAPSSVVFDFDKGVKTTIYADGRIYEEGFDPRRSRGLASRPDGRSVTGPGTDR